MRVAASAKYSLAYRHIRLRFKSGSDLAPSDRQSSPFFLAPQRAGVASYGASFNMSFRRWLPTAGPSMLRYAFVVFRRGRVLLTDSASELFADFLRFRRAEPGPAFLAEVGLYTDTYQRVWFMECVLNDNRLQLRANTKHT